MKKKRAILFMIVIVFLVFPPTWGSGIPHTRMVWDFEKVPVGQLPPGWTVEATRQAGPLATWKVIKDKTAPSGTKVLALVAVNHHAGGTFNLCWTNRVSFLDGTITVAFKAVRGRIDEGGGILWRARDKNNYYVARFNPLEDNFRIYYVKQGIRRMIGTARVKLAARQWHTMTVVAKGDRYTCYLNGRKYLDGHDAHVTTPGGVGLWTKADAVTSFDDFKIVPGD